MKYNYPLLAALVSALSLHAGGLYLTEISTTETALAGAGWAARAQDAGTVFSNPAGMTELEGRHLQSTLQPLYTPFEFEENGGGTTDAKSWIPTGGLAYTQQLNDRWTVGAAIGGYFGLAMKYEEDWPGDFFTQEVTLQSISLQPRPELALLDWQHHCPGSLDMRTHEGFDCLRRGFHMMLDQRARLQRLQ